MLIKRSNVYFICERRWFGCSEHDIPSNTRSINITDNTDICCRVGNTAAVIYVQSMGYYHTLVCCFRENSLLEILQSALKNRYRSDIMVALEPINKRYCNIAFNLREAGVISDVIHIIICVLIASY